jgi:NAD(P)-dependent dehydrogenase (short-subunit alcohol dehydrogenase family)
MAARFRDRVAIVTGGGSGIAQAVCMRLASEEAAVVVADINPEGGEETVSAIRERGGIASYARGDVTVAADCERMIAEAVREYGRLDVLANIAGGSRPQYSVVDLPEEQWRWLVDLNLTSVFLMSKYAIPRIAEAGGGAIVNVSSGAGVSGMPLNPGYVAAKGGVIALTKAMALDHAAQNIRVNCVAPGPVLTPLMRRNRTPEEIAVFASLNPLNRVGLPEELADAIVYLASDESSFITAQTINVDGGVNR